MVRAHEAPSRDNVVFRDVVSFDGGGGDVADVKAV